MAINIAAPDARSRQSSGRRALSSRERAKRAIRYETPDMIPVMHAVQGGALYEHGEQIYKILAACPQDFGEITAETQPIPYPDPADVRDGHYYRETVDAWGARSVATTFGQAGHVVEYPIQSIDDVRRLNPPNVPAIGSPQQIGMKDACASQRNKGYYNRCGWVQLFDTMRALRKPDDLLMDLAFDNELVNMLADTFVEHEIEMVTCQLESGADGIQYADDWGTQSNTLVSLEMWRHFFKPRYARMFAPTIERGKDVFFHTCGHTLPFIDDLAELGVNVIWPQISVNDNLVLAEKLHKNRMAIMWDADRQHLLSYGSPAEIEYAVSKALSIFGEKSGGLIWYGELFPGYPLENIEALYRAFNNNRICC
jgi:uroporphyrinogen decarboxylase